MINSGGIIVDVLPLEELAEMLVGFTGLMVAVGTAFVTALVWGGADLGQ